MIVGILESFLDNINFIILTFTYSKKEKKRLLSHQVHSKMAVLVMVQIPLGLSFAKKKKLSAFLKSLQRWPNTLDHNCQHLPYWAKSFPLTHLYEIPQDFATWHIPYYPRLLLSSVSINCFSLQGMALFNSCCCPYFKRLLKFSNI